MTTAGTVRPEYFYPGSAQRGQSWRNAIGQRVQRKCGKLGECDKACLPGLLSASLCLQIRMLLSSGLQGGCLSHGGFMTYFRGEGLREGQSDLLASAVFSESCNLKYSMGALCAMVPYSGVSCPAPHQCHASSVVIIVANASCPLAPCQAWL